MIIEQDQVGYEFARGGQRIGATFHHADDELTARFEDLPAQGTDGGIVIDDQNAFACTHRPGPAEMACRKTAIRAWRDARSERGGYFMGRSDISRRRAAGVVDLRKS